MSAAVGRNGRGNQGHYRTSIMASRALKADSNAVECAPLWERFASVVRIMGACHPLSSAVEVRRIRCLGSPAVDPTGIASGKEGT